MGYFFSFDIECGAAKEAALAIGSHFEGSQATVPEAGITSNARTAVWQGKDANWVCSVMASGVSIGAPEGNDIKGDQHILAVVLQLYERLKSAPPFRFAVCGFEMENFYTHNGLLNEKGSAHEPFEGLVLAIPFWEELERPAGYEPFREGYVWCPLKSSPSELTPVPMI